MTSLIDMTNSCIWYGGAIMDCSEGTVYGFVRRNSHENNVADDYRRAGGALVVP